MQWLEIEQTYSAPSGPTVNPNGPPIPASIADPPSPENVWLPFPPIVLISAPEIGESPKSRTAATVVSHEGIVLIQLVPFKKHGTRAPGLSHRSWLGNSQHLLPALASPRGSIILYKEATRSEVSPCCEFLVPPRNSATA